MVFAIMALIVGVVPLAFDRMREAAQYRNTVRTMISDMRVARQQDPQFGIPGQCRMVRGTHRQRRKVGRAHRGQ